MIKSLRQCREKVKTLPTISTIWFRQTSLFSLLPASQKKISWCRTRWSDISNDPRCLTFSSSSIIIHCVPIIARSKQQAAVVVTAFGDDWVFSFLFCFVFVSLQYCIVPYVRWIKRSIIISSVRHAWTREFRPTPRTNEYTCAVKSEDRYCSVPLGEKTVYNWDSVRMTQCRRSFVTGTIAMVL